MSEEWKKISEFPTYSISNAGRVRNDTRNRILVGGFDRDGYRQVTLSYNGKQYNRRICRLVANEFIENPNGYPCVNHIDENKSNDNVTNLEWCTYKYNNNYGIRNELTRKKIMCIETEEIYSGVRKAARELGISHTNIGLAARNGGTSYGFHWKYI